VEGHRPDPLALLFGILFSGIGLAVLVGFAPESLFRLDLLGPAVAILAGVALLLSARRHGEPDPSE
jgi:uncharacterized membrane protein